MPNRTADWGGRALAALKAHLCSKPSMALCTLRQHQIPSNGVSGSAAPSTLIPPLLGLLTVSGPKTQGKNHSGFLLGTAHQCRGGVVTWGASELPVYKIGCGVPNGEGAAQEVASLCLLAY